MKRKHAGDFSVSVPSAPVSVWLGDSVTLPCSVTPPMDVSPLEVRWYRPPHHNAPFLLYKDRRIEPSSQDNKYQGGCSWWAWALGWGARGGNVSLSLRNVTMADSGAYECYVGSLQWCGRTAGECFLCVGRLVPKPSLIWRNREGRELKDQQGLFYSTGWIARFITLLVLSVSAISVVTVLFIRSRKTSKYNCPVINLLTFYQQ
ncbi:hypothetical protein AAFF_G00035190 [Aldrovandia affinis]|uniref:Ig-like domain-containing protein n=1 Tax=Aldrovandia affinis TaxID=143900 RepID=A0AAD7R275_9TELE|nr:hypothetical protein AAFF_G00035190 [Aldrovandia affinis]